MIDRGLMDGKMLMRRICYVACSFLVITTSSVPAHEHSLPLGDGQISARPERGRIFACETHFFDGGGAFRSGDWIANGRWWPSKKPVVPGNVNWPGARITVTREGALRVVRANNLPKHASGTFPVPASSVAYQYDRNPNNIEEQQIMLNLPATASVAAKPSCVPMGMVGFALSGVAIFNALDMQGRDAPAHEIQDKCNGHPEQQGQYHYHDWSPCLAAQNTDAPVGWILDGFPILGPRDSQGKTYNTADLDACHGRIGAVFLDGKMQIMYHYRFTADYPSTIGCFHGTPVSRSGR
jgi:YHYH protein